MDKKEDNALRVLILIFFFLAAGIILVGYFSYADYAARCRSEVERQLSAIADLKATELKDWRKERLGDAQVFYRNETFSRLVGCYIENPADKKVDREIRSWLGKYQAYYQYDRIMLLDTRYRKMFLIPDKPERANSFVSPASSRILKSGKIAFEDFYSNEQSQQIYLKILVPIFEGNGSSRIIAVLAFRIDPNTYLYPYINNWPTASRTAETLLVRREGNEVVFLNELRFLKNTALKLRFPLERQELPVVKAVLGQEGTVEGRDYRDEPVIAAVRAVPGSPWYLSARMDVSEVNAPLRERLWLMIALVAALLIGTGASAGFVWRHQRARYYREKYEAGKALRESEDRYRSLYETTQDSIFIVDQETGAILDANPAACRLYGYARDELSGLKNVDVSAEPEKTDRAVKQSVTSVPLRYHRKKDGTVFPVEIAGGYFMAGGKRMHTAFIRDITERRQAEEALRQSEDKYRSIFENAVVGIFQVTPEGRLIAANHTLARMYGYENPEDMIADVNDIARKLYADPEDRKKILTILNEDGLIDSLEHPVKDRNGRAFWVSLSARAVRAPDGRVLHYEGTNVDITERKLAEEALKSSEEKYKNIFETIVEGVYRTTPEGRFVIINPAFAAICGYASPGEMMEKVTDIPNQLYANPEDRLRFQEQIAAEGMVQGFEVQFKHPTRGLVWVSIHSRAIRDEHGIIRHYDGTIENITERKQAAEALRQSEENFRRSLDESPLGVRIVTLEGDTLYVNRALLDIYGYESIEELRSTPVSKRYTPKSYLEFQARREQRRYGFEEPTDYVISIIRKDGNVRHLEVYRKQIVWDNKTQYQVLYRDITERRQIEDALRERDIQFRKLSAQVPGMIYQFMRKPDGTYCVPFTSEAIRNIFGCSPEDVREDFSPIARVILPEDLDRVVGSIEYSARYLTVWTCEYRVQIPGRSIRWMLGNATPEKLADGSTVWYGFNTDVTERKRKDEELRAGVARYRTLIETTRDLIYTTDRKGCITYMNPALEKALGYFHHELKGKPFAEILAPEYVDKARDIFRRAMKGEVIPVYEVEMIRRDGTRLFLEFNTETIYDKGEPTGRYGVGRDITERKRAEEALHDAFVKMKELEFIIDHSPAVVWLWKAEEGWPVEYVSSNVSLFGYTPDDFTGGRLAFSSIVHPDDISRVGAEVERYTHEGRTEFVQEYRIMTKSGDIRWVDDRTWVRREADGTATHYQGIVVDITERRRAEDELRQSHAQMRALAERLQQIREESQIAIAREIHDELGGGLTGVKMDLSWLSQMLGKGKADKESDPLMKRIQAANQLIDDLIRNVRRIGTTLRPSVLDDLGLIAALEWESVEFSSRTGIQCEFVSAYEYVNLADTTATAVFRIFQEAMTNVARHSGADKVTILFREDAGYLYLEVMDNGRGITEPEVLGMKSLGILGMRERALVFGGELSISGEPGRGTTVVLKIPIGRG